MLEKEQNISNFSYFGAKRHFLVKEKFKSSRDSKAILFL